MTSRGIDTASVCWGGAEVGCVSEIDNGVFKSLNLRGDSASPFKGAALSVILDFFTAASSFVQLSFSFLF